MPRTMSEFESVCVAAATLRPLIRRRVAKTHWAPENFGQCGPASCASRILNAPASATKSLRRRKRVLVLLLCATSMQLAHADVIVLANRTGTQVPLRFLPVSGEAR